MDDRGDKRVERQEMAQILVQYFPFSVTGRRFGIGIRIEHHSLYGLVHHRQAELDLLAWCTLELIQPGINKALFH